MNIAELKFRCGRNCTIAIPRSWNIPQSSNSVIGFTVHCISTGAKATLSWNGEVTNDSTVLINAKFGSRLGFRESDEVVVCRDHCTSKCVQVTLKPATREDWQILELNVSSVEYSLLNQIRILWKDLVFPIWVQPGVCAFVRVANTRPMEGTVEINRETEVHVIPEIDVRPPLPTATPQTDRPSVLGALMNMVSSVTGGSTVNDVQSTSPTPQDLLPPLTSSLSARLIGADGHGTELHLGLGPTQVALVSNSLGEGVKEFVAKVRRLQIPGEPEGRDEGDDIDGVLPLRGVCVCSVKVLPNAWSNVNLAVVPLVLRMRLGLEDCSRIIIEPYTSVGNIPITEIKELTLYAITNTRDCPDSPEILKSLLTEFLQNPQNSKMLFSKGAFIQLEQTGYIVDTHGAVGYVKPSYVTRLQVNRGRSLSPVITPYSTLLLPVVNLSHILTPKNALMESLGGCKDTIEDLEFHIRDSLQLLPLHSNMDNRVCLLTSFKGVGKTTISQAVSSSFSGSPYFVYVKTVGCSVLRGKRHETLQKEWELICQEMIFRSPSVLIFDDLDSICGVFLGPEGENGHDAMYFYKVSQVFIEMVESLRPHRVSIIVTANSWNSLNPSLTKTDGLHLFAASLHLKVPDKMQRQDILRVACGKRKLQVDDEVLEMVSGRTEGYVARDLMTLVERSHLHMITDNSQQLTMENLETVLNCLTPISLRGLNMHPKGDGNLSWENIGGLKEQKQLLKETFLWPTLYPHLLKECPIRPVCGVLLYGAPGTGKTLLASALASEAKVNFISIKGPELLSKYIGASEQAVRDVFQRAQSAKPCVIFFDEFDSMAPRRGHDSTGVTDRCVNQLLTLLDGVETDCSGVAVLAATSRPDIIDPALLRPGRLDRSVQCDIPDESARLAILKAVSRNLEFSGDVDLSEVAKKTENFTGADLQALLYTAQLSAFQGISTGTQDVGDDGDMDFSKVTYVPSMTKGWQKLDKSLFHLLTESEREEIRGALCRRGEDDEVTRNSIKGGSVIVSRTDVEDALRNTRPSLSHLELNRFMGIYDSFRNGGSVPLQQLVQNVRATLA